MNMKRRTVTYLLALVMVFALLLSACDANGNDTNVGVGDLTPDVVDGDDVLGEPEVPAATDIPPIVATDVLTDEEVLEDDEVLATDVPDTDEPADDVGDEVDEELGDIPDVTSPAMQVVRSSALLDWNILDSAETDLGEIEDILFNREGEIAYVIVDDTLGDNRLLEWNQVTAMIDEAALGDMSDDTTTATDPMAETPWRLTYAGTVQDVEALPAFDMDLLDDDVRFYTPEDLGVTSDEDGFFRLSRFLGTGDFNLLHPNDDDLGEIEDVLVNLQEGRVTYGIVEVGGFLGIAEKAVAVPWERFQFDETEEVFRLDLTAEQLESAPAFDETVWNDGIPNTEDWNAEIDNFWDNLADVG